MFSFLKLGGIRLLGENLGRERGKAKSWAFHLKGVLKVGVWVFLFFPFFQGIGPWLGREGVGWVFFPFFLPFHTWTHWVAREYIGNMGNIIENMWKHGEKMMRTHKFKIFIFIPLHPQMETKFTSNVLEACL